jgi:hypothetical protein
VYPPKDSECSAWNLPIEDTKPLHDQGRFHIPLNVNAIGDPEPIQRILDLDLGTHRSINPVGPHNIRILAIRLPHFST